MTEDLPIQRWKKIFTRYPASEILPNDSGEYVTYAGHLAALRACEARVRDEERSWEGAVVVARAGYQDGYLAALQDARDAVEDQPDMIFRGAAWVKHERALFAIDALRESR